MTDIFVRLHFMSHGIERNAVKDSHDKGIHAIGQIKMAPEAAN